MTIVITNETKHSAIVSGENKYGIAEWADTLVAWDAPLFSWDSKRISATNETKHNAIISNQLKS